MRLAVSGKILEMCFIFVCVTLAFGAGISIQHDPDSEFLHG